MVQQVCHDDGKRRDRLAEHPFRTLRHIQPQVDVLSQCADDGHVPNGTHDHNLTAAVGEARG
jgi:hypothetical protein